MVLAVGLAATGAVVGQYLVGTQGAVLGAVIGTVCGTFAPSLADWLRERGRAEQSWLTTVERPPPGGWARLLDPRQEVVGFIGRANELAALVAWCEDDSASRLRLVTGPGGVGKTRLAVEISQRMARLGWTCQRVADGQEDKVIGRFRATSRRRVLLVVDYAETRTGLSQMLRQLAGEDGEGVRVLLLARSAGDWWDQLGVETPAVWDMVQSAAESELALTAAVTGDLSDADVVTLAVRAFASRLGVPERTVEIYGSRPARTRVLDLHVAALVAVLDETGTETVRLAAGKVLDELLRHEKHYWYDTAQADGLVHGPDGLTHPMLRQVVAASCLIGARTEENARLLPARVPGLGASAKVGRWLRELYPPVQGDQDWLGSLQPDRLAERHVVCELAESLELTSACLTSLDAFQARRVLTLLARASIDDPEAEPLLERVLPAVAAFVADIEAPPETLAAIYNAIPYPTVVLAPAATDLSQRILSAMPSGSGSAVRAQWLTNLGVRLSALGRPADALLPAEEAVTIYRDLAAADTGRYRHALANALTNLGVRFSELGRAAEALPPTEEAVTIYRDLTAVNPGRYRPDLADSLINLGTWFSELGRPADSAVAEQEAVTIYRDLTVINPGRYRPDLAGALSNLGVTLSDSGDVAEALPLAEEAVAIYRDLAATDPDQYRPALGDTLTNLGCRFSELGRVAEALPPAEEAVTIYRDLVDLNPERYRPDLAGALTNLWLALSESGHVAQALPLSEEAVLIYRDLACVNPGRYRPGLASALAKLGAGFFDLGRVDEALPPTEEAVTIYRDLASANPARFRPDLAGALTNLNLMLSGPRPADALPFGHEAVAIYQGLDAADRDRHRPDLARALTNLGITLSGLDRLPDALQAEQDAVVIRRELAAADLDQHRPDLAHTLVNLGITLSNLSRPADALSATEEAVTIYRDLATANPDQYLPGLAESLTSLGIRFTERGRPADALLAEQDAVAILRELAAADPDQHRYGFARALTNLGITLLDLDHPADAMSAGKEAVTIYRDLTAEDPDRYRPELIRSLTILAAAFAAAGLEDDADRVRAEVAATADSGDSAMTD